MGAERQNIWLTRISMKVIERSPLGSASTVLFIIGLIPAGLFLSFYFLIAETATVQFFYLMGLGTLVAVIGPYLLFRYDTVVFPNFIDRAKDVTPSDDDAQIKRIGRNYKQFFAEKYYYICIPWTALILIAVYLNFDYYGDLGVNGYTDPVFVPYLLLCVVVGVITGMGLHMALTTVLCIREVGDLNFTIDPLHPDGLGGLSAIGYFAISSTTLFSIGSLGLPVAFDIASSGRFTGVTYFIVVIYIGTVVLSFVYPTLYINRRAKEIRRDTLESKREQIYSYHNEIMNAQDESDLGLLKTKLKTLRDEYDEYDRVNLYPMSPSILSKLLSSIMLPLVFLLLETYVIS